MNEVSVMPVIAEMTTLVCVWNFVKTTLYEAIKIDDLQK
jgi:hypothetical protein